MINTDRRLKLALEKIAGLKASRDALTDAVDRSEYEELISQIQADVDRYVAVQTGTRKTFLVRSLDDLGPAVIWARLARRLSQRQLAQELGVSEQNVQKDEARRYEGAGVGKLGDILDVLDYEFVGMVRPKTLPLHQGVVDRNGATYYVAKVAGSHSFEPVRTSIEFVQVASWNLPFEALARTVPGEENLEYAE